MKRISLKTGVLAVAGLCLVAGGTSYVLVQANTTHTFVSASRAQAYSSLKELNASSANVVVGTVTDSRVFIDQDITTTEYELSVTAQRPKGSGVDTKPDEISVIIDGTPETVPQDENFHLKEGSKYLLFLVDSNAVGTLHRPYYVTGVWAGIYRLDAGETFVRLMNKVDLLPQYLTFREVLG